MEGFELLNRIIPMYLNQKSFRFSNAKPEAFVLRTYENYFPPLARKSSRQNSPNLGIPFISELAASATV